MEQPDLFRVPETLSPRLEWMKRHKVLLYCSLPDDPEACCWYAAFDRGEWPGHEGAADYFGHEIAANGDLRIGVGMIADDALADLCEKRVVPHWTVEALHRTPNDSRPRRVLWDHLHDAHKLTLLDSELAEIIRLARDCLPPP